ncbi:MAG TPA: HAD family phosphatase, partial [Candidatus Limnocylindrales bacterium]|nr:HAD family phosphatase [Candidatus Limnocylindrales bacterium]
MTAGRRFDLVIFDCDGVLVDSERLSIRLDVELLAQLGWPMSEVEVIDRFVGRTDAAMRAEIEAHLGRDIGPEWEAFADRYVRLFAKELRPVVGIVEAVDEIQAAGYATCVASSGGHEKIRRNLALTGLA